jgi:hypothetical protein
LFVSLRNDIEAALTVNTVDEFFIIKVKEISASFGVDSPRARGKIPLYIGEIVSYEAKSAG